MTLTSIPQHRFRHAFVAIAAIAGAVFAPSTSFAQVVKPELYYYRANGGAPFFPTIAAAYGYYQGLMPAGPNRKWVGIAPWFTPGQQTLNGVPKYHELKYLSRYNEFNPWTESSV